MDEIQNILRDTQARFLSDRYSPATRRAIVDSEAGWSPPLWKELAELGLLAAPFAEEHGGVGEPGVLTSLMEGFGRALLIEPYVSTVAIGGKLFSELGDAEGLAKIADGSFRLAFAHDEYPEERGLAEIASLARRAGDGFHLAANKLLVQDAMAATHLLISSRMSGEDGLALFLVPAGTDGLSLEPLSLIDGRRAATLRCDDLFLPSGALLSSGPDTAPLIRRLLDEATLAVCGEAVGILREMLAQTVAYTQQRKQFGQPLSAFQVLQHRMADMLVDVEQAQSLVTHAVGAPDDPVAVSLAKLRINEALRRVSQSAVQLHGGIGTTDELELSQFFRRATAIERQYGTSHFHLQRIEAALADQLERGSLASPYLSLTRSPADEAFRDEVRAFLDEKLTPGLREEADRQSGLFAEPDLAHRWHKILHEKGWVAPSWPRQYGGPGWDPRRRLIFEQECALANAPLLPTMGLQMCGPVLMAHGTEAQKAFFLPRMLSGEHRWCQGYSEPEAGSDLASLRCKMERDGDEFVINGTKIWTTYAHAADWMFLLVRTDSRAKAQAGISFVLVPMDAPGLSISPILSMSGEHEVNQVFLDDVRVPVANLVGEENQGWQVAKFLLEFERGGGAATARTLRVVRLIRRWAVERGGLDQPTLHRLALLETEVVATQWTQLRMLKGIETGGSVGNTNASILKLKAAELYQEASKLFHDALGLWGLVDQRASGNGAPDIVGTGAPRYMNSRAVSIFGGSTEIQRTILAKHALGL